MKLFFIDLPGWGIEQYIVRAETAEQARELIRGRPPGQVDFDDEVTELSPEGEPAVLWSLDSEAFSELRRLRAVRKLLEENGCECPCDHHPDERGPDCEVCLACRIGEAVGK